MALPQVGAVVNYYWSTGAPVPALVRYVDDVDNLLMVSYMAPPAGGVSGQLANVTVSPWASQGTGVNQWQPTS